MGHNEESKDVRDLKQVLETVGEKVPQLIRGVLDSLYTKEAGASMGQSVGAYYQELIAAGLPQEAALEMTKEYSFSLKQVMNQGKHGQGGGCGQGGPGEDRHPQGFSFSYTPGKKREAEEEAPREQG